MPEHTAIVAPLKLDTYEVTVGRFRKFYDAWDGLPPPEGAGSNPHVADSGWRASWNANLAGSQSALRGEILCPFAVWTDTVAADENKPMNCMSWYTAFAFCIWDGARLPTEAEWEFAAAGGSESRLFAWGSALPDATRAKLGCAGAYCQPDEVPDVGSYPAGAGRWGHLDLAQGVMEWVLDGTGTDSHYSNLGGICDNCAAATLTYDRYRRSAQIWNAATLMRATVRSVSASTDREPTIGVRCARNEP